MYQHQVRHVSFHFTPHSLDFAQFELGSKVEVVGRLSQMTYFASRISHFLTLEND